jgi:regulator of replication initiation timing
MEKQYSEFIEELKALEQSVYALLQKNADYKEEIEKLKEENLKLSKENEVLKETLNQLEKKIPDSSKLKLSAEDKETLKSKIDELIARIDYHLK